MKIIENHVVSEARMPRESFKDFQGAFKLPNQKEIKMLAERIRTHGFVAPVFVWYGKDFILDGHQRVKALNLLALSGETLEGDLVPVVNIKAPTEKEARQRVAEFNSKYSEIDPIYAVEWLKEVDLQNLPMIGFDMPELDEKEKEEKEDVIPVVEVASFVKRGDIFKLGKHVIMCGDSTDTSDLMALMAGAKADMVFTDPPYNVGYKGSGKKTTRTIENDDMGDEQFDTFLDSVFERYMEHTKDGSPFYVFHAASTAKQFHAAMERKGIEIIEGLVWNKPSAGMGMNDYRRKHEPFFYAKKKGEKVQFFGDRTNTSVWDFKKSDEQILRMIAAARKAESEGKTTVWTMKRESVQNYVHPTQKPVELVGYAIQNSSKAGDIILDLFAGSGSTLIACEKHSRECRTMELDPVFAETVVKRFAEYDGGYHNTSCLNRSDEFEEWKNSIPKPATGKSPKKK